MTESPEAASNDSYESDQAHFIGILEEIINGDNPFDVFNTISRIGSRLNTPKVRKYIVDKITNRAMDMILTGDPRGRALLEKMTESLFVTQLEN